MRSQKYKQRVDRDRSGRNTEPNCDPRWKISHRHLEFAVIPGPQQEEVWVPGTPSSCHGSETIALLLQSTATNSSVPLIMFDASIR